MAAALRRLLAVVALLLLGAHFLRGGHTVLVGLCVLAVPLPFVSRPWPVRAVRSVLVAGTAVWLWTAWSLVSLRRAAGEPYLRMLLILLAVATLTVFAAWSLPSPSTGAAARRDSTP